MTTTIETMKALTVHQPYAWAISMRLKPVENRDWPPPRWQIGSYLAIHSSKKNDRETNELVSEFEQKHKVVVPTQDLWFGCIVAVAKVTGVVTNRMMLPPSARPFFIGVYAWVLAEVCRLPTAIPAQGKQGLWGPSVEVLAEVQRQWKAGAA